MKKHLTFLFLTASVLTGCQTMTTREAAVNDYSHAHYLQAYKELTDIASTGDPVALYAQGYMQYYGVGTAVDKDRARVLIRKAADLRYPPAVLALKMISEDHPNMRIGPLGRRSSIQYSGKVDDSVLVHDVNWLRERDPEHYTIQVSSNQLTRDIVAALSKQNHLESAGFHEFAQKKPEQYWALGDFDNKESALQSYAELSEDTQKKALISTFKNLQHKMLPE